MKDTLAAQELWGQKHSKNETGERDTYEDLLMIRTSGKGSSMHILIKFRKNTICTVVRTRSHTKFSFRVEPGTAEIHTHLASLLCRIQSLKDDLRLVVLLPQPPKSSVSPAFVPTSRQVSGFENLGKQNQFWGEKQIYITFTVLNHNSLIYHTLI